MIGNMIGATYSSVHYEEYGKYKNKNLFEEVIDKMMLENFPTYFREKISTLSKKDKRMAILSLLDKDRNLFMKIKSLINEGLGKYEHIKDVILMLREYVKVGEVEKKKYGEVMTPLELVKDMVNTLPEDVWKNPNLKWLDPANGTGPYPLMVIYKLMGGLKDWEPNEEKRYKHIVENMIYVCELQPKNMFLYMCAVDPWDNHDLNIYTGSFLSDGFDIHMKEVWGVDKFDVIIGNPPYNSGSSNKGSAHVLWDKFVIKSFGTLINNGYLSMVHPSGWRSLSGGFDEVKNVLIQKDILYLEIHNERDGMRVFGAETRYDFYCVRNSTSSKLTTKIKCQNGEYVKCNTKEMKFIPNSMFDEFLKLKSNSEIDCVEILYDCSYHHQKEYISSKQDTTFKYPCIYTVKNGDVLSLKYSSRNDRGHYGIPKLVWSNGRIISVGSFIDKNGEYALNQFSYGIVDEVENLEKIKKAFDSKKFRELMEACSVANMSIDRKVLATFRKDFWKEFI